MNCQSFYSSAPHRHRNSTVTFPGSGSMCPLLILMADLYAFGLTHTVLKTLRKQGNLFQAQTVGMALHDISHLGSLCGSHLSLAHGHLGNISHALLLNIWRHIPRRKEARSPEWNSRTDDQNCTVGCKGEAMHPKRHFFSMKPNKIRITPKSSCRIVLQELWVEKQGMIKVNKVFLSS